MFHLDQQVNQSFPEIKALILKANEIPLRYYDRTLPVTVQADASLRGLGVCLIQQHKGKDQLIAFASKSLTDAEIQYANIEREVFRLSLPASTSTIYNLQQSTGKEFHSRE